jgi:hypothetical protein
MRVFEFLPSWNSSQLISHNSTDQDGFPDVSPDTKRVAYASEQSGQHVIATKEINDVVGTTEQILESSSSSLLMRPRWSCQQDKIAYAERNPGTNDTKLKIVNADGSGAPVEVVTSGTYAGHDWGYQSQYLIFSSQDGAVPPQYRLYVARLDGTVMGPVGYGVLPVISHNGNLLAYVYRVKLAPGTVEQIVLADAKTLTPVHQFGIQPAVGGTKIAALGFTGDDQGLYIATEVASVPATEKAKRYELFRTRLDGSHKVRLTNNQSYDSQPDGIPKHPAAPCSRCIELPLEPETGPTQSLTINGIEFTAAVLPNGDPSSIAITNYCPMDDGNKELKIGWSQSNADNGKFAAIVFTEEQFGDGVSSVEINACRHNSLTFRAYDKNSNLIAEVPHTAGQHTLQSLTISGGSIARIDVVGAEIGISSICAIP